jgi:hypothetical protein
MELWARHLCETVRPNGGLGFSRFHILWGGRHITVEGNWDGQLRARGWVFGKKTGCRSGYVEEADRPALEAIAAAHARLAVAGKSSEAVLDAAVEASDWADFEARLGRV